MNSEAQKKVFTLMAAALGAFVFGMIFIVFGGGLGVLAAVGSRGKSPVLFIAVGLGFLLVLGGVLTGVYALVVGLQEGLGDDTKKPVETVPHVYIVSKLILDKEQGNVFEPEMYEEDELDYLVQVRFPSGKKEELTTSAYVWGTVGEGMMGAITYQGRWLSRFVPEIKPSETPNTEAVPPDPFASGTFRE